MIAETDEVKGEEEKRDIDPEQPYNHAHENTITDYKVIVSLQLRETEKELKIPGDLGGAPIPLPGPPDPLHHC